MPKKRKIYIGEGHYHYVTFSCYRRKKLLKDERAKQIVVHVLSKVIRNWDVTLTGFVIMPDHVHLILGYMDDGSHSRVIQEIKRVSSRLLINYLKDRNYPYLDQLKAKRSGKEVMRIWQPRYYDFNLYSEEKLLEKLNYMHQNPVRVGLVIRAEEYKWSSSMYYEFGRSVGVEISAKI